jgi:hypothetical protein
MENSQELITDAIEMPEVVTEETISAEPQMEDVQENQPEEQKSIVDQLIDKRTGYFSVKMDLADLKWVKNACNSGGKFSFTGPNEAFMVMNCFLGFSSAIARVEQEAKSQSETDGTVQIQAAAIEAAAILLNKYEGSGLDTAQRVFRIAMALNPAIMDMKELDKTINFFKNQEKIQSEMAGNTEEPTQAGDN